MAEYTVKYTVKYNAKYNAKYTAKYIAKYTTYCALDFRMKLEMNVQCVNCVFLVERIFF